MKISRMTVLADLIKRHGWKRGAELGLWQGATFGYLLSNCPELHLIGVDHWRAVGSYADKHMAEAEATVMRIAAEYASRATVFKTDTVTAADLIPNASLDFVFIDASHDTLSVLIDVREWLPKVRSGGALTGHDANWPSVAAALDATLPSWQLLEANVWYWKVS